MGKSTRHRCARGRAASSARMGWFYPPRALAVGCADGRVLVDRPSSPHGLSPLQRLCAVGSADLPPVLGILREYNGTLRTLHQRSALNLVLSALQGGAHGAGAQPARRPERVGTSRAVTGASD